MGASTPLDAGGSPAGPQIDKHQPSAYISAPRVRRTHLAQVAELVDALVSGTSGAIRGGSSPLLGTTVRKRHKMSLLRRAARIVPGCWRWFLASEECRDLRVKAPRSRPRQHHDAQPD